MTSVDEGLAEYRARHRQAYLQRKRQEDQNVLTTTLPTVNGTKSPVIPPVAPVAPLNPQTVREDDEALSRRLQIEEDERLAHEIAASMHEEQSTAIRPPDNQFSERLLDSRPISSIQQTGPPQPPTTQVRYTAYGTTRTDPPQAASFPQPSRATNHPLGIVTNGGDSTTGDHSTNPLLIGGASTAFGGTMEMPGVYSATGQKYRGTMFAPNPLLQNHLVTRPGRSAVPATVISNPAVVQLLRPNRESLLPTIRQPRSPVNGFNGSFPNSNSPGLQTPSPVQQSDEERSGGSDPEDDPEYRRQLREAIARSKADITRRS